MLELSPLRAGNSPPAPSQPGMGTPGCLCHLLERAMTQMWALPLPVVSVPGTVPGQVGIDSRDVTFMRMQGTGTQQVCVCTLLLNKSGEVERYA